MFVSPAALRPLSPRYVGYAVWYVWYVVRWVRVVRMVWYWGATFVVVVIVSRTKSYVRHGAYPGIDMWWKVGEAWFHIVAEQITRGRP